MNSTGTQPFIEAADLCKVYHTEGEDVHALRDVTLSVRRGEFAAVIGPSGCGKSTLLYVLGGLAAATSGSVRIEGKEIGSLADAPLSRFRGTTTGFVFQRFNLLSTLTVRENISLAQKIRGACACDASIDELLDLMGLASRAKRKPAELSMGEQQRAAIARAVIHRPAILLADEPTGNLDSANSVMILDLFSRMHREMGQTILLVTHNQDIARAAGRIIRMRDGRIE
jgi:putative ABC transport system ATP-binding protein